MKYLIALLFLAFFSCNTTDKKLNEALQGTWIMFDNPDYYKDKEMEEPLPEPLPHFRNPVYSFEGDSIYNSNSYFYYDGEKDSIEYFGDYSTFEIKNSIIYYEYPKNNKMEPILKINKVTKDTIFSEGYLLVRQKVNTNLLDYDEIRFSETNYNGATVRVKFSLKKNGSIEYKKFRYDDLIRNEKAQVNKAYLKLILQKVDAIDFTLPKKVKNEFIICGKSTNKIEFYKNNKLVHKDDLDDEISPTYYDLINRLSTINHYLENIKPIK
ncbi:hypothetical protein [Faecalibacter bovis]|uniref:Lipoprotein n=1 Tax=Faecalibacter bovis TaxID=2898187 RepID=A0ABX7XD04_9FLAO|nr:hypothetical protein [Faecalibacter bovis]QTV05752.1 hypothetical protein J9309_13460 [Faecalibacter bovis]